MAATSNSSNVHRPRSADSCSRGRQCSHPHIEHHVATLARRTGSLQVNKAPDQPPSPKIRLSSRPSWQLRERPPRRRWNRERVHGRTLSNTYPTSLTTLTALQKGIFIAVALVPVSMVAYSLIGSNENNFIVRTINAYKFREETWDRRNTLHEAALRQAAHDRNLLMNQPMDQSGPDLGFPEYVRKKGVSSLQMLIRSAGNSTRARRGMWLRGRVVPI